MDKVKEIMDKWKALLPLSERDREMLRARSLKYEWVGRCVGERGVVAVPEVRNGRAVGCLASEPCGGRIRAIEARVTPPPMRSKKIIEGLQA